MKVSELFKRKENSIYIELEIYKEKGQSYIYISEEGSTGVELEVNTTDDIMKQLKNYLENRD